MKTLILYATKHGAAGEIAKRIADRLNGAVIYDLKQSGVPSVDGFDCVIIGSSLYAGMIRKEAKAFLSQNTEALCKKKLGLFLCGIAADKEKEYLTANIPTEILQSAAATAFPGGIFDPKKAGAFERFIMKIVAKQTEYTDIIDNNKIQRFLEELGLWNQ